MRVSFNENLLEWQTVGVLEWETVHVNFLGMQIKNLFAFTGLSRCHQLLVSYVVPVTGLGHIIQSEPVIHKGSIWWVDGQIEKH